MGYKKKVCPTCGQVVGVSEAPSEAKDRRRKLEPHQYAQVRSLYPTLNQKELAEKFGVSQPTISAIVNAPQS